MYSIVASIFVVVTIGFLVSLISNFAFTVHKLKFGTLRFTAVIISFFCCRCETQFHLLAPLSLMVFIIYLIQPPATHLILQFILEWFCRLLRSQKVPRWRSRQWPQLEIYQMHKYLLLPLQMLNHIFKKKSYQGGGKHQKKIECEITMYCLKGDF